MGWPCYKVRLDYIKGWVRLRLRLGYVIMGWPCYKVRLDYIKGWVRLRLRLGYIT